MPDLEAGQAMDSTDGAGPAVLEEAAVKDSAVSGADGAGSAAAEDAAASSADEAASAGAPEAHSGRTLGQAMAACSDRAEQEAPVGLWPTLEQAMAACSDRAEQPRVEQAAKKAFEARLGKPLQLAMAHCDARIAEAKTEAGSQGTAQPVALDTAGAAGAADNADDADDDPNNQSSKKKYYYKTVRDPAWHEAIDPKSGKPYYWHFITREARWKCPTVRVRKDGPEKKGRRKNRTMDGEDGEWDGSDDDGDETFQPSSSAWKPAGESSRGRARRTRNQQGNPTADRILIESGLRIIAKLSGHRRRDNSRMADEFFELPDADEVEDYYRIVARPISLKEIKMQLKKGEYICLTDLLEDFQLMFDNCYTYNDPICTICQDAKQLQAILQHAISEEEGIMQEKEQSKVASGKKVSRLLCRVCRKDNTYLRALNCDRCQDTYHLKCLGMTQYPSDGGAADGWKSGRGDDWLCDDCHDRVEKRLGRLPAHTASRIRRDNLLQRKSFYSPGDFKDYDLASDPRFAEVCSFWLQFGEYMRLPKLNQDFLEDALLRVNTKRQQLLTTIHAKLLRGLQYTFDVNDWEKNLVKFARFASMDREADVLLGVGYYRLPPAIRLTLLKHLMVAQFDENDRFRRAVQDEYKQEGSKALRFEAIGEDQHGNAYWYLADPSNVVRLYRAAPAKSIEDEGEEDMAAATPTPSMSTVGDVASEAGAAADGEEAALGPIKIKLEQVVKTVPASAGSMEAAEAERAGAKSLTIVFKNQDLGDTAADEGGLPTSAGRSRSKRARRNSLKMTEALGARSTAAADTEAGARQSAQSLRTPQGDPTVAAGATGAAAGENDGAATPTTSSRRSARTKTPASSNKAGLSEISAAQGEGQAVGAGEGSARRSKRRREDPVADAASADQPAAGAEGVNGDETAKAEVKHDGSASETPKPKRRRRAKHDFLTEQCLRLLGVLKKVKLDGESAVQQFLKLPSKDDYPDYYLFIKHPFSFACLQRKAKRISKSYATLDELKFEFDTMVANAKLYNQEGSQIWDEAEALDKAFKSAFAKEVKLAAKHRADLAAGGGEGMDYLTPEPSQQGGRRSGKSTGRSGKRPRSADVDPDYEPGSSSRKRSGTGLTIKLNLGGSKSAKKQRGPDRVTLLKERFYEREYRGIAKAGVPCRTMLRKLLLVKDKGRVPIADQFVSIDEAEYKAYRKKCHRILLVPNLMEGIHLRYHTLAHFRLDFEKMVDNTKKFYGPGNPKTKAALKLHGVFQTLYKEAEAQHPELRFIVPPEPVIEEEDIDIDNTNMLAQVHDWLGVPSMLLYGHGSSWYGPVGRWLNKRHGEFKKQAVDLSAQQDESWKCMARSIDEIDSFIASTLTSKESKDEVELVKTLNELMRPSEAGEAKDEGGQAVAVGDQATTAGQQESITIAT